MKITREFLKKKKACTEGIEWFCTQKITNLAELVEFSITKKFQLNWASWLLTRCLTQRQCVRYAIYAAEQVLDIFEKKFPDDDRPRRAIETAKRYVGNNSAYNAVSAASSAASEFAAYNAAATFAADAASSPALPTASDTSSSAAAAHASAAYASAAASSSAASATAAAALAAAYAAEFAAYNAAESAAYNAYASDADAAYAAADELKIKILKYGLKLKKKEKKNEH